MNPRQADSLPTRRWRFGNVEFDERSLVLKRDGQAVEVEPKPLEVLRCLLERAGEVVPKDALMRAAWPGRIITDASLAKTINRLREALGDRDQNLIETHHRYGYRLVAPLSVETLDRAEPACATFQAGRDAEHRPLTVLFCDLADTTQLAESLESEAFREVLVNYQRRAAEICARYEGHVAQQLGEGLLIYFGYPAAHDDDAERALRCACELVATRTRGGTGSPLALRVGVHSGTVLIGCLGSGGEPLATGAGIHLAAHLQALAEPGMVLMSEDTFRLVSGLFVTRDFGPQAIRGLGEPMRVHQVIQPSGVRSRLEAASLTPYAGRELEIEMLTASWRAAVNGEGRAVLISGEPGLGKSRLLLEVRERLSGGPFTWLECRAAALTRHSVYQPWVELLQRALGIRDSDSAELRLARLEQGFDALGLDPTETIPLLGPLLNLDLPARYGAAQYGPELQRKRRHEALVNWLLHLAQQQPLVLVFEDLHWADDGSLACLGLLLKRLADMPVLLLMAARTEFVSPWMQYPYLHFQTLDPLPKADVEHMLGNLAGDRALPSGLRDLVLQRAGGVPLFVEELTRSLLESGPFDSDTAIDKLSIPGSLRALLMARLDRLGRARELIQTAAVVGREVPYRLLTLLGESDESGLSQNLRTLTASGLMHARGTPPDATYVFKHALIQDAAYEILLKPRRQVLHSLIAEALEKEFPERARNEPEFLALHFEKAALIEAAVGYWSRAAGKAIAASAYAEAIRHGEHALQLLLRAADKTATARLELELLVDLGSAKLALLGRGNPDLLPILNRSQSLCAGVDDADLTARTLANLALTHAGLGDYAAASRAGQALLDLAKKVGSKPYEGVGHVLMCSACQMLGDHLGLKDHSELGLRAFGNDTPGDAIRLLGVEGCTVALMFSASAHWALGYPDLMRSRIAEACARAESLEHPHTLSSVKSRIGWFLLWSREPLLALEQAQAGASYAERYGFREWQAVALLHVGIATGMLGRFDEGLELIRRYQQSRPSRTVLFQAMARGFEAQVCLLAGRTIEARQALDLAFGAMRQYGERYWEAELHRLRGELLLVESPDDGEAAETCFRKALEIARSQQARSLELRAATSLARLWQRSGREQEADAILRPVYAWFTEGFETPDLIDAAALLGMDCAVPVPV